MFVAGKAKRTRASRLGWWSCDCQRLGLPVGRGGSRCASRSSPGRRMAFPVGGDPHHRADSGGRNWITRDQPEAAHRWSRLRDARNRRRSGHHHLDRRTPGRGAGTPVLQPSAVVLQPSAAKESARAAPKAEARQSEIGAGLLAATAGGIVPGGRVEFGRMRRGSGLGWQVDLTVPAARGVTSGAAQPAGCAFLPGCTRRPLGDAKVLPRRGIGRCGRADLRWGQGYATNQSDWSPTWGLGAGIRAGVPWGRTRLWLDLRAVKWLREQSVRIDPVTTGTATTANLPSWDAQGSIGISYIFQ